MLAKFFVNWNYNTVKNAVFSYYEKIGDDIENIDTEIPFNLPDNWIWCRGCSCFSGMETTKPQGEFFDYIDIDSIDNRLHCIKKTKRIPVIEAPSRASRAINSGSVLFSLVRPYLENIALFGTKSDGKKVLIILPNAICTEAFELETKNAEQSVFKVKFESTADPASGNLNKLDVKIIFEGGAAAASTFTSKERKEVVK